jgi:hypothetical protein
LDVAHDPFCLIERELRRRGHRTVCWG